MRRPITALASLILRIFFKHVEVIGLHRVPDQGAVIFVLNHPSGLIDPLFILTLAPRPVTFLAKAPLFSIPVIGWFARGIDAIPVYRPQDGGSDTNKNTETFEKTRRLLMQGKSIAIFPEGTSHSDPHLKPLKSGAARIALGAKLERLTIVPAGLNYTSKGVFRSSALLLFGEPFEVYPEDDPVGAQASTVNSTTRDGEPSREAVQRLTESIRQALSQVLLQTERPETLALIERAEAIYSGVFSRARPTLNERFERRRRFMAKYEELRLSAPETLAALENRLRAYDAELARRGLLPANLGGRSDLRWAAVLLAMLITAPLSIAGIVIHYPAYRLVGYLAKRLAKTEEDLIATIKVLGAMLFFPLSWILAALAVGSLAGARAGLLTLFLAPLSGYAALLATERLGSLRAQLRNLRHAWFDPETQVKLRAEGEAIHNTIQRLGESSP